MFIAHLPAGYIAAQAARSKPLFWGILIGSILPDTDMLWFYFIDHGQISHHHYLTHRPILWACILLVGIALRRRKIAPWIIGLGLGGLLHMLLDSLLGSIAWGWPVSHATYPLIVVPATQDWWVMSFVLHWTFLIEITLCAIAAAILWRNRRHGPKP